MQLASRENAINELERTNIVVDTWCKISHKKQNKVRTFPTQSNAITGLIRSETEALINIRTKIIQPIALQKKNAVVARKEKSPPTNANPIPNSTV